MNNIRSKISNLKMMDNEKIVTPHALSPVNVSAHTVLPNSESSSELDLESNQDKQTGVCSEDAMVCCGAFSIGAGALSIIGGSITLLVFCIISLCSISWKTTKNHCPGSELWVWLLVTIIYNALHGAQSSKTKDKKTHCCTLLGALGILSWGTYEMWGRSCTSALESYLLYKMSFAMLIFGWVVYGGVIIGTVAYIIVKFSED